MAASVRIKIDDDLPVTLAELVRAAGHDALTVFDESMQGAPDGQLWSIVQGEHRMLITADKGFGDVRTYPPGTHAGVVLLRAEAESRSAYEGLMSNLLSSTSLDNLRGSITVVTTRGIRTRRA